jgi:drug/metabolite transporter (DMT)-like permease
MNQSRPGLYDYGLLLFLALIWGASFFLIKIAVVTIPPATLTLGRLILATAILLVVARMVGQQLPKWGTIWIWIALAGFLGNALPFTLINWGQEKIDSGISAILMAVMPLFTIILAHIFTTDEKMTARKLIGVCLGFIGMIVLIGPEKIFLLGDDVIRQLAVAGAATCYAFNAMISKKLSGYPRRGLVAGIMLTSMLWMIPYVALIEQPWDINPSLEAWGAMVVLGIVQTAFATLLLFTIISRQGASFFSQINFLVPITGIMWGAIILAERPSTNAWIALGLILLGIAITRERKSV